MKLITGLIAASIAIGSAAPAQALPNYLESKGITYAAQAAGTLRVSALITLTGAPVWTTQLTAAPPDLTMSLALDKGVLFVTGYSLSIDPNTGFVWALDAETGQILWSSHVPGGGIYSSATASKGLLYIAGAASGAGSSTTALDAATGAIVWQFSTIYPVYSSPTVDKDTVTLVSGGFPSNPTYLIVLDAVTGALLVTSPVP